MMLNAWHLPVPPFVKQSKDQLLITLWLTGEDPPQRIMLRTEHDNEEMSVPMHKQRSQPQPGVTAWRAAIDLSSGQPRRRYSFKLLWHDRQRWFTPQGFSRMPPARLEQFAVDVPDIGPQWAADQIFYQIFPDRFARSLPREAEQDHVYYHHAAGQEIILRDWDEPVTAQAGGSTFYGGDLDGISEKLPYLKKLGVTALYLNPVFKAPSVHKYDTEDYRHVDPQFGGDGALLRLRHNTQQLGMRLVLDGVFNHSGDSHAWFDRHNRGTGGACHNPESPWRDWYSFSDDGTALDWLGYASLPKLDYQSESLVNEIYRGEDSIVRHWLKAPWNMDGWRLDVSPEVYPDFWRQFRRAVLQTNPDAIMIAECWHDSREWCTVGDMFDGTMHYVLSEAIWKFFAERRWSLAEFDAGVNRAMMLYPQEVQNSMWNFLSSHDTARMLTRCGGRVKAMRAAVFFQMTHPGVPVIYYGDELAMRGGPDPDCRRSMTWDKVDGNAMLAYYKRLTHMRGESEVLREGTLRTWEVGEDGLYAYLRQTERETVLCALNTSERAIRRMIRLPEALAGCKAVRDLMTGKTHNAQGGYVTLALGVCEGAVLGRAEA